MTTRGRWAVALALLLTTTALAGCIGSDDAALEGANTTDAPEAANATDLGTLPDGSPVPTMANLTGCHEQAGAFPVPMDAAGQLPDGFEPVPFGPAGATATLIVISLSCSLDGEDHGEVWGMLEVKAPDEHAPEDGNVSLLALGAFSSSQRQAEVYKAWGLGDGIAAGNVTVETLQDTDPARAGHVLGTDGDFTVHMYSTVGGEPAPETAGTARVFGAVEGELTGAMDVAWTDSQAGFQSGEGTLAFEGQVPLPQPESAGVAWHYWGEDYDVTFEHVDLET